MPLGRLRSDEVDLFDEDVGERREGLAQAMHLLRKELERLLSLHIERQPHLRILLQILDGVLDLDLRARVGSRTVGTSGRQRARGVDGAARAPRPVRVPAQAARG